jgi:hypothetical protein
MAYMIQATGTAVVAFEGQDYTIHASSLKQGPFAVVRPQRFSEDDVECTASFTAETSGKTFTWVIYYTEKFFSTGGVEIDGSDVTPGTIKANFSFTVEFDDDEDSLEYE